MSRAFSIAERIALRKERMYKPPAEAPSAIVRPSFQFETMSSEAFPAALDLLARSYASKPAFRALGMTHEDTRNYLEKACLPYVDSGLSIVGRLDGAFDRMKQGDMVCARLATDLALSQGRPWEHLPSAGQALSVISQNAWDAWVAEKCTGAADTPAENPLEAAPGRWVHFIAVGATDDARSVGVLGEMYHYTLSLALHRGFMKVVAVTQGYDAWALLRRFGFKLVRMVPLVSVLFPLRCCCDFVTLPAAIVQKISRPYASYAGADCPLAAVHGSEAVRVMELDLREFKRNHLNDFPLSIP